VFDVDGVLLDDKASFRAAVIATARFLTSACGAPEVTIEEVAAFKRAGGLNNDWDLAYALVGLLKAKYEARLWGDPVSSQNKTPDMSLTQLAAQSNGQGLHWVRSIVPPDMLPDYAVVQAIVNEYYWGSDLLIERLGQQPQYVTDHRGYVWQEPPLIAPGFLVALNAQGVKQFGIITGRNRPELSMGLDLLGLNGAFGFTLTAEDAAKPDPQALNAAVAALGAQTVLYIGDTRDDLELVRNYRASFSTSGVLSVAAIVAPPAEWSFWQSLGVDLLLSATSFLPEAIAEIRAS
jgi:HAD superfamily hydrolase (TIGR01548 family)